MSFFSAGFCIFQKVTCRRVVIFHIFKLKKQLFAIFVFVGNPINKNRVVIV